MLVLLHQEVLLDWPVDDTDGANPVFETSDFTANKSTEVYRKVRAFLKEKGLVI